MIKPKVIILGKIPPPYFGPAIATEIILNSRLKDEFNLIHIDSRINSSMKTFGKFAWKKFFLTIGIYNNYIKALFSNDVVLVLLPIAQETTAILKDTVFIFLAKIRSKKIILHLRGSALNKWYNNRTLVGRFFFKWVFSKSSGAIVLGNKLKYIFEPFLSSERIFVIPNGADCPIPARSTAGSKISVLYFANLQASKGIEDVLNAIGLLSENIRNRLVLNVAGSWSDDNFEKKCTDIVLNQKLPVFFHQQMTGRSKWQIFADADIFVFTPRGPEGHPWVIIEAMAASLPIISTDKGAITESVINGVNGFIVDTNSPSQIAGELEYLMNHSEIRNSMGRESRRLYEENLTEEKMVKKLTNVFNTILNMP